MILKKLENGIVVSAEEIKSFEVTIDSNNNRAIITVILDNVNNSKAVYNQAPGDKHIYQIVDNNNIIRLIHQ
jgi:glutamate formiminotransferase